MNIGASENICSMKALMAQAIKRQNTIILFTGQIIYYNGTKFKPFSM